MVYKFNIAGPGSPEIEIRQRFLSNYRLFMDGNYLGKLNARGKRKLIKMDNGDGHYITLYQSWLAPFSPPVICVDGERVFFGEQGRLFEKYSYFILFLMTLFLTALLNESIEIRDLRFASSLLRGLMFLLNMLLLSLGQYYYYSKARAKLKTSGRIIYFIINLAVIVAFNMGAKAVINAVL